MPLPYSGIANIYYNLNISNFLYFIKRQQEFQRFIDILSRIWYG